MPDPSRTVRLLLWRVVPVLTVAAIAITAILIVVLRGGATMVPTEPLAPTEPDVPPIDANAPIETNTATFAMG